MLSQVPKNKEVVLVGGGHAHAILLRKWGMNPLPSVQLTLISDVTHAPYSGMLPGFLAGYYSWDEVHIDLRRLAKFADARFIHGSVTGVNAASRTVSIDNRPAINYHVLSLNIGSRPSVAHIKGAEEHGLSVKPVHLFIAGWEELLRRADSGARLALTVVGGGAGGVEVALAARRRFGDRADISLIHGGKELLPAHNKIVSRLVLREMDRQNVRCYLNDPAIEVTATHVICKSGREVPTDKAFIITHAAPQTWLQESEIPLNEQGFIRTKKTLQSVKFPFIFAAGDIAAIDGYPRPKSGVFSVREASPLFKNIQNAILRRPPIFYVPQAKFLGLLGLPVENAIASKGLFGLKSKYLWNWKEQIDRRFMDRLSTLPNGMSEASDEVLLSIKDPTGQSLARAAVGRCAGCAAKVGPSILRKSIDTVLPDMEIEDASVLSVPAGKLVQSIDYFPAIVDDPYLLARVITSHAFSDIYAMGAAPHSALSLITAPFGSEKSIRNIIEHAMQGFQAALGEIGATLLGGHTSEGYQLSMGLSCNGHLEPDVPAYTKGGLRPGDSLILTKALGTGAIFAAHMQTKIAGKYVSSAIESMLVSNYRASRLLRNYDVSACTDITGFGLAGHIIEMIEGSGDVSVKIKLLHVPILPGASALFIKGINSSLYRENKKAFRPLVSKYRSREHDIKRVLYDPQTSGGLLVGVASSEAEKLVDELKSAGYHDSRIIGEVVDHSPEPTESCRVILY